MHTLATTTLSAAIAILAAVTPAPGTGSHDRQPAPTEAPMSQSGDEARTLTVGDLADFGPLLSGLGF